MIRLYIGAGLAILIIAVSYGAGVKTRDAYYQRALAEAQARFDIMLRQANDAMANQKLLDDTEIARLQKLVDMTPPDPSIALKKEAVSRIGAIK